MDDAAHTPQMTERQPRQACNRGSCQAALGRPTSRPGEPGPRGTPVYYALVELHVIVRNAPVTVSSGLRLAGTFRGVGVPAAGYPSEGRV